MALPKICVVCGDKALGLNFSAITCESCKAFFRRNALIKKKLTCPFNQNCDITIITRRFCQKCRLDKCFSVGMNKEHIMSEEDKKIKKHKIEQNRVKRKQIKHRKLENSIDETEEDDAISITTTTAATTTQTTADLVNVYDNDSHSTCEYQNIASVSSLDSEQHSFHHNNNHKNKRAQNDPVKLSTSLIVQNIVQSPENSTKAINEYMKTPDEAIKLIENIISSQQDAMKLIGHLILYPGDALKIISKLMNSPFDALTVFTKFMSSPNDAIEIISKIVNSPEDVLKFMRQLMNSPGDALNIMNKFMETPAEALKIINKMVNPCSNSENNPKSPEIPVVISTNPLVSDKPNIDSLLEEKVVQAEKIPIEADTEDILKPEDIHMPSTTTVEENDFSKCLESILSEAIKLEYEVNDPMPQNTCNEKQLTEVEAAKLIELKSASLALLNPVDIDLSDIIDTEKIKCEKDSQDPQLLKVINLTAVAIRRLIKMSKKINAFRNMCQEDQIALLKGGCIEMMLMRSVMSYDCDRATWKIPHSQENMSNIRVDVLKLAKGNVYEEHERFIQTFDPKWRKDENIILMLCAIVLFSPFRPRVIHSDVIKLEQNSYYYLLRRYLESIYPGCEAKSTFLKLIQKISEVEKLNTSIIGVYLNVNPSHIEPLLREIFDLKNY